jgi:hypothetical protein
MDRFAAGCGVTSAEGIKMRRLFQLLLNSAAGLSLILCIATVVLWVRSYWVQDRIDYQKTDTARFTFTGYAFSSNHGSLYVIMDRQVFREAEYLNFYVLERKSSEGFSYHRYPSRPDQLPRDSFWNKLGFSMVLEYDTADVNSQFSLFPRAFVPHWFVVLLTALSPAIVVFRAIRKRRVRAAGLCPKCGYDLRATPQRCPECGHSKSIA